MAHLDCHAFFNFLVDERANRLRLNACAGIPEEEARRIEWLDYGTAFCGCAARDGNRIVASDILHTPDPRTDLVKSHGIQAYACNPLIAQGRVIGTLWFGTRTRTCFTLEDLDLMKTVADQVATAMERIRLIEELQRSRDELDTRVQERTAELQKTNESLRIHTTMLEQSNRDLEDFAYVAAHDLQEPARKIRTFADRLLSSGADNVDGKVRDYLERILRAASRMQELVLDLLKYSRLTSTPEPLTRFNLRVPLDEAVTDLSMLFEETGGKVEIGDLPVVEADRVQMRQLFQNLLGNGLKYRGEHQPWVSVYDASSEPAPFWEIHVRDNGIGFEEAYMDKIFKPFQRLHGMNAPYQGTGMGLAICRRIVERHGGSITARSNPGEGSTFIVRLLKK
jgi:signal transduction histidine kinase